MTRATPLASWDMLDALLWGAASGFAARFLLSGSKPGPLMTMLAGFGGCFLGFLFGHEILRMHEFHLFVPETLIPAVLWSTVLLVLLRRAMKVGERHSIFS